MEEQKTNVGTKKLILVLILLAALIAAVVFIVKTHGGTPAASQQQEAGEEEELKGDPLDTPMGELIIPEAWSDQVEIEDTSADDTYSKSFYKTVGDQKVLLYELIIGENGAGYELGSVPDKNGDRQKVWLNINVIDRDESWSDDEYNEINTIQSGVNELIDQIYQMKGFEKSEG